MNFTKILFTCLIASLLSVGFPVPIHADEPRLDFNEVFELLKSQVKDRDVETMEDAAARGLIESLAPRVRLGDLEEHVISPDWPTNALKSEVVEEDFGYVHISEFAPGLTPYALEVIRTLNEKHELHGLILDLRFCHGTDYSGIVKVADLFYESEEPLINHGAGLKSSSTKTNAIQLPLVVLVNSHTRGAAEALAAILRQGGIALIIGGTTAGEANIYREFKLTSGPSLWIATDPVKIGADNAMPFTGVEPDISLAVPETKERQWMKDPYSNLMAAESTSSAESEDSRPTRSRRLSEAELVRIMREGDPSELDHALDTESEATNNSPPLIQDPALARAVDFLKGLAVVRKFKAN